VLALVRFDDSKSTLLLSSCNKTRGACALSHEREASGTTCGRPMSYSTATQIEPIKKSINDLRQLTCMRRINVQTTGKMVWSGQASFAQPNLPAHAIQPS
jgi:hypothetical protein